MDKRITLKAARINANLTQEQAARKIGVNRDTISKWENGKSSPSVMKLKIIEKVYGISYNELDFFIIYELKKPLVASSG